MVLQQRALARQFLGTAEKRRSAGQIVGAAVGGTIGAVGGTAAGGPAGGAVLAGYGTFVGGMEGAEAEAAGESAYHSGKKLVNHAFNKKFGRHMVSSAMNFGQTVDKRSDQNLPSAKHFRNTPSNENLGVDGGKALYHYHDVAHKYQDDGAPHIKGMFRGALQ